MGKHLSAIQFDGLTFGMDIDTNTATWKKFKPQVKREKRFTKYGTEQSVLVVSAEWLGAIMGSAHWLVTECQNFEKFNIEGFMNEQYIYVNYKIKSKEKEKEIMGTEVTRSAAVIAAEINAIKSQTSGILEAAFTYAKRSCFEIGKRLEEAKSAVPFGEWGAWLEENVSYSVSTANDLMRIYREFGNEQIDMLTGKSDAEIFEGLSQSQMVALFGLPKAMRAEFVEEHREELESGELSFRKLKEEIKRLNELVAEKDKEISENDESYAALVREMKDAEAKAAGLQIRIDELEADKRKAEKAVPYEAKVTETVYEASPEQIAEIRAAAVKETEDKLSGDAKKAQEELKKIKKDLEEKNRELEARDKKVRQLTAQSDPRAAKVSYCLESIGRAMADINAVVDAMNSENAGSGDSLRAKCEAALMRLCNTYGWQI